MTEEPASPALVPELIVEDLSQSLAFWCDLAGFSITYQRPETGFAFVSREGAAFMLEQRNLADRTWETGELVRPYGRGINFEVHVVSIEPTLWALRQVGWPLYAEPEEKWYRIDEREAGVRQFLVQDPDGYLLRFSQHFGWRAATAG